MTTPTTIRAVRNARLVTPDGILRGGLLIEDGRIVAIEEDAHLPSGPDVLDAQDRFVLPGIVDPEAHLGSNAALDEDFSTESRAAVAAGVTTWGLQLTTHTIFRAKDGRPGPEQQLIFSKLIDPFIEIGQRDSRCDFFLTPLLMTVAQANEIPVLAAQHGVTTYKLYMHMRLGREHLAAAWPQAPLLGVQSFDDSLVFTAMREIAKLGRAGLLSMHCENWEIARVLEAELRAAGRTDIAAWNERSPGYLEAMHVRAYSYLAKRLGCRLHIQHVSAPETLEELKAARAIGVEIYGQTAAHYLTLDAGSWKLNTPLRPDADHPALWSALASGVVNSVGSDHVNRMMPRNRMEGPSVWEAISGFPSRVEAHLPVMLSEGVAAGRISMQRLCQVLCENPAKLWGVWPRKGAIRVGADADLVMVDMNKTVRLRSNDVLSATGWSAYEDRVFRGWPILTVLRGDVVAEWDGDRVSVAATSKGSYLARATEPWVGREPI